MAPSATSTETQFQTDIRSKTVVGERQPIRSSGSLDKYETIDVTPIIGTEFPKANLVDWINAPNADELLRDLAVKSKQLTCFASSGMCQLTVERLQSPNEALSFSVLKTTSQMISRSSSSRDLAN